MDDFATLDAGSGLPDAAEQWPEQLLQQFDIGRPLGQGAQGSVFLGFEYRLQRSVAIKRITHQPLNDALLAEAQAQAKIEHPNVSKLFQVIPGDFSQPSYLVMQYIEGQTALDWALQQRALCHSKKQWQGYIKQVVIKIQQVCSGLEALHSKGIVHRDIKPANIMITTDQAEHPFIVDFGLAQHQAGSTGSVSGSWPFMSPEQKNGDPLSSASDIYSLGVTLYQLLTAELPPSSDSKPIPATKVSDKVSLALPVELNAIIRKCLAIQRQNRYQSAAELNQELQRYLAGEPVQSIFGKSYRIKKKLIKHRWAVLFFVFLSLAVAVQATWMERQKSHQQAREKLIEQFHQTVQQAQYQSNLAYMAPPHDIRYLQSRHQHNLEQIIQQAQQLGQTALPFALYAKGRIAQQQGDHFKAKQQLEAAWQQGFQTGESAYALVQVLDALYQQALTRLYIMPHGALRQAQQTQLQQSFVQPIIGYLNFIQQQSKNPSENLSQSNQVQALLHYYNQNYHQAIGLLLNSKNILPWQYQHYQLLGQSYLALYQQLLDPNAEQAKTWLGQAKQAFDKAIAIAPSDPNNYLQKWQLYITLVGNRQYGSGDTLASLNNAQKILERALELNPAHLDTQANLIRTRFQRIVYLDNQEKPWQSEFEITASLLKQTLKLSPQQPKLLRLQAKMLSQQLANGPQQKTDEQYLEIEQLYRQLAEQQQLGFDDLIYYALHLKYWGDFIEQTQRARSKYQAAATLFEQAIAGKPEYSGSYVNLALIELKLSETDTQTQGLVRLDSARSHLKTALEKGYSEFIANYYLAKIDIEVSHKLGNTDMTKKVTALEAALKAIERALVAQPSNFHAQGVEIKTLFLLVENQWYLQKSNPDQVKRMVELQTQRLEENPDDLSAIFDSNFILTAVLEKQLHGQNHKLQQLQDISEYLSDKLSQELPDSNIEQITPEQTLALSNLLYSQMLLVKMKQLSLTQIEPLIERFKHSQKNADHHWTLANYHQLKSRQTTDFSQQRHSLAKALTLWQQAHALQSDNIGYHYSLLKGYLHKLILLEQHQHHAQAQSETLNTVRLIKTLNQSLENDAPLKRWSNTLIQKQGSGKLLEYLKTSQTENAFSANLLLDID